MQPRETVGAPGRRGELGDAERRGVRAEDRLLAHQRVERGVGGLLRLDVLDDRLDDQIAACQVIERGGALQVSERRVPGLLRHLSPGHAVAQELVDTAQAFLQERVFDLAHDRPVTRLRRHLRDTGAHEAAPQNAHCHDCHRIIEVLSPPRVMAT